MEQDTHSGCEFHSYLTNRATEDSEVQFQGAGSHQDEPLNTILLLHYHSLLAIEPWSMKVNHESV